MIQISARLVKTAAGAGEIKGSTPPVSSVRPATSGLPFNIDEPLLEGHYDIRAKYLGQGIMEYTYAIEVSPVPLPAAIWLFGSGLIGLIGIARRKKS